MMDSWLLIAAEEGSGMSTWVVVALLLVVVVQTILLIGLVLNVNKILDRASGIRRQLKDTEDSGLGAQFTEAISQLESLAVSLDRVAERCETIETTVREAGSGERGAGMAPEAVEAMSASVASLKAPLDEIRGLLGRTKTERVADEIKRTLHNMGFDVVTIKTDLAAMDEEDGKVQVEVAKDGVTSKGYVVIRDGGVVDQKISKPYEMFP